MSTGRPAQNKQKGAHNMDIDWKRKLTSRKFWAAIAEFVTMLVIAFKGTEETATQVAAIIMAGASVFAYIIGEGLADAAGAAAPQYYLEDFTDPPDEEEENVG